MIHNFIKIAIRNLKKHRQFSLINIVGLSIALAVVISIFLFVQDELSYDRNHPYANRLYRISMNTQFAEKEFHSAWSPPFLGARLQSEVAEIENFATLYKHFKGYSIKKDNEEIPVSDVYYASPYFFHVFGFKLKSGNKYNALSDLNSIVLSEQLADRIFPGESLIGKTIETTEGSKTVTGIISNSNENTHFHPQVITPLIGHWEINDLATAINHDAAFYNYILLSKENSLNEAFLNLITEAYFREWINADESRKHDFGNQKIELQLQNVRDIHLNSNLQFEMEPNGNKITVIIISFVAVVVMIVACINYMILASARYMERIKEQGIRKVLGSGRRQLALQYFTESLMITLISTVIALIIVQLFMPFINSLSGKILVFSQFIQFKNIAILSLIVMGCAILSSIYPAAFISNIKTINIFKLNSPGIGKGSGLRKAFLVTQIAVSGILLMFTFVVFQQFRYMQHHELGFQQDQVMVIEVKTREARAKIPALKNEFLKLSSIISIGLTGQVPGGENLKTEPIGFESNEGGFAEILTNYMFTGPDIISALGLRIVEGSNFNPEIGEANRGQEVLVNQTMVKAMNWKNPIGKKVKLPIGEAKVVGVVNDFHLRSLHYNVQPLTIIYLDNWAEALLVKTSTENLTNTIRSMKQIYNHIMEGSVFEYSFLDDHFARQYKSDRQLSQLFILFSFLTIFIALMGLVGLIGFSMIRRSKEISIRRVFGANSGNIIFLLSREYGLIILIGLLIAIPVANYLIKDWLSDFPYKIDLSFIYFGIPSVAISLFAAFIMLIRISIASKANPADLLRDE